MPGNQSTNTFSIEDVKSLCEANDAHLPLPRNQQEKFALRNFALHKEDMSVVMLGLQVVGGSFFYPNGEQYVVDQLECSDCAGMAYTIHAAHGGNKNIVPAALKTEGSKYSFVLPVCEK